MRNIFLLAVLLAAACVAGGSARGDEAPLVIGGTSTVSACPDAIGPFQADGIYVYERDTRCNGVSDTLPSLPVALCWRAKAIEYLVSEVAAKRLIPGRAFTVCDWAYSAPASWSACVEVQIRNATPEIRFARSPSWVEGSIQGVPYTGCAAGIAYPKYVRVSLADWNRLYPLVSWETSNSILAYTLDRWADADGPITSAATAYARAACPAY